LLSALPEGQGEEGSGELSSFLIQRQAVKKSQREALAKSSDISRLIHSGLLSFLHISLDSAPGRCILYPTAQHREAVS